MVNGPLPVQMPARDEAAARRPMDMFNFMQICGLFASNMGKNRVPPGTRPSSLPVRFNSNTLKKSDEDQRDGHVFSHSRGFLAEHRHYSAADGIAAE
jgi:hypothetical protein